MNATGLLGWLAAVFVLASFSAKSTTALRLMGAASNVVFILYGVGVGSAQILILHALLFPINVVRLLQSRRLQREVAAVSRHADIAALLLPHMRRGRLAVGQTLFRQGEPSDTLYYVLDGEILLQQSGRTHGADDLIGVMGCFTIDGKRLDTAVAQTPVALCTVPTQKVRELMLKDPRIGSYLLRTISHRAAGRLSAAPPP